MLVSKSISHQDCGSGDTIIMQDRQHDYRKEDTAQANLGDVSSSGGDGDNNDDGVIPAATESSTGSAEREVREERVALTRDAASRLESILNDMKSTTNRLLREIDVYTQAVEDVTIDHLRVQASQQREAQRLEEVEPDVAGATSHFPMNAMAMMEMQPTNGLGEGMVGDGSN